MIKSLLSDSRALFWVVLLAWAPSCAPPPGGGGTGGSVQAPPVVQKLVERADEISSEYRELARPGRVQAWVGNLAVKAQPGKDMPQVATLSEGELAEYLYQRTIRKSDVLLRGQKFHEPWILIRTHDGVMGWVHEGAVKFINPGLDGLVSTPDASTPASRTRGLDNKPSTGAMSRDFLLIPGKRAGLIQVNTSEEQLATFYGAENIGRSTVKPPDKPSEPCTVLFPDSRDEICITWKTEERKRIKAIYLEKTGGKWVTAQGLQPGISLYELAKINQAPVSFYGFGWTYSGVVNSWNKGALAKYEKHFYTQLEPGNPSPANFKGDKLISSNADGLEDLAIKVARVVIYLD